MDHHAVLQLFSDIDIGELGEQATRDFLGETLFLVVWVVDGHIADCLLEALVFAIGISEYQ